MGAGIPSSADYLCTSSRDSFHCNGAKTPGSKPSQADGKMFLFSSLKLFIKGSLLPRASERDLAGFESLR